MVYCRCEVAQSRTSYIERRTFCACDGFHAYHDSFNPNFLYQSSRSPTFAFSLHFSQIPFYLSRWRFCIVIFLFILVQKTKYQFGNCEKETVHINTNSRIVFIWWVFDKRILISAKLTVEKKNSFGPNSKCSIKFCKATCFLDVFEPFCTKKYSLYQFPA